VVNRSWVQSLGVNGLGILTIQDSHLFVDNMNVSANYTVNNNDVFLFDGYADAIHLISKNVTFYSTNGTSWDPYHGRGLVWDGWESSYRTNFVSSTGISWHFCNSTKEQKLAVDYDSFTDQGSSGGIYQTLIYDGDFDFTTGIQLGIVIGANGSSNPVSSCLHVTGTVYMSKEGMDVPSTWDALDFVRYQNTVPSNEEYLIMTAEGGFEGNFYGYGLIDAANIGLSETWGTKNYQLEFRNNNTEMWLVEIE
jgi:hypothetical protein